MVTAAGALYTLADLMPMAERQSLLEAELVMAVVVAVVPPPPPPLASPMAPVAVAMAAVLVVLVSMRVMVSTDVLLS